jgi:hypothetical protein
MVTPALCDRMSLLFFCHWDTGRHRACRTQAQHSRRATQPRFNGQRARVNARPTADSLTTSVAMRRGACDAN